MVNYWLCVTNEENWEVVKKRKVWGVSERNKGKIERVKTGDVLVFYVKPKRLAGIFNVISEPFQSDEKIFSAAGFFERERFPYRVRLKPYAVPETPVNFDELVSNLKFITIKAKWFGYLRTAMRAISEEDYKKIKSLIHKV